MGNRVDFTGRWNDLYSHALASGSISPELMRVLGWLGAALVVWSLFQWVRGRSSGKGGDGKSKLGYTLVLGAALAAPHIIIPAVLTLVDAASNFVVGLFQ